MNNYSVENEGKLKALYKKAETYFKGEKYEKAIESLKKAIFLEPLYYHNHYNLGRVYMKMGDVDLANTCFEEAMYLSEDSPAFMLELSEYYIKNNMFPKAKQYLEMLLTKMPSNTEAQMLIGAVSDNMDDIRSSLHVFYDIPQFEFNSSYTYYRLSEFLRYENSPKRALTMISIALAFNPNDREYLIQRGVILLDLNYLQEAERTFNRVIEIHPDCADAYKYMSTVYEERKEFKKSLKAIEKAIRISPTSMVYQIAKGYLFVKIGELENAIKVFEQATKSAPKDSKTFKGLGVAYAEAGKSYKAERAFKKALRINPDEQNIYILIGLAHQKSGNTSKAIDFYNQAISQEPTSMIARQSLALLYKSNGEIEKAVEQFQSICNLELINDDDVFIQGMAGCHVNEYDEAIKSGTQSELLANWMSATTV